MTVCARCFSTVRQNGSIASGNLLPSTPAGSSVSCPAVSTRCLHCKIGFIRLNLPGDGLALNQKGCPPIATSHEMFGSTSARFERKRERSADQLARWETGELFHVSQHPKGLRLCGCRDPIERQFRDLHRWTTRSPRPCIKQPAARP